MTNGHILPLTLTDGAVHGCTRAEGHDGGFALRFQNAGSGTAAENGEASDYVDFGRVAWPREGASLCLWLKTSRGGCRGWCGANEWMPADTAPQIDARTEAQRGRGGTLVSTMPLYGAQSGVSLLLLQPRAHLTARVCVPGAPEWLAFGLSEACDDRWHMLSLTVSEKRARVYVDGEMRGEGALAAPLGEMDGPLVLGADSAHQNGAGECTVSGFTLEAGEMTPGEIAARHQKGALAALKQEIFARDLVGCGLYDADAASAFLKKTEAAQAADYPALKEAYERFLLQTKAPDARFLLISDIHCEGESGPRTAAFRKALNWARELGMQAIVDCGDYSAMGEEDERESFWNALDELLPGAQVFSAPGNHETLALRCDELVRYQNQKLSARGMVEPGHDKLFFGGDINGYPVLVLSQYSDTYTVTGRNRMWRFAGEIKPEQTAWLSEQLKRLDALGKPVFVTIHNAHGELLCKQTDGRFAVDSDSAIIDGEALYQVLAGHKNVILCTGHVHHGLGDACGLNRVSDGYAVIDVTGFRSSAYGYGTPDKPEGHVRRHSGFFAYLFGKTLLLRAADFSNHLWLTAYDQTYTVE